MGSVEGVIETGFGSVGAAGFGVLGAAGGSLEALGSEANLGGGLGPIVEWVLGELIG